VQANQLPPHDLADRLAATGSVDAACRAAVTSLGEKTGALVAVLLPVGDQLRCVAATGAWQVYTSIRPGSGVTGRVFRSGRTETLTAPRNDPDYIPIGPEVALEVAAPILDFDGRTMGVLNVEWADAADPSRAQRLVEETADRLALRMCALGGPPAEGRSEKLLRHAINLTSAVNEWELMASANGAARDVSGLNAAVLIVADDGEMHVGLPTAVPGALEQRLRDCLRGHSEDALRTLVTLAHRHGSSYTLGEAGQRPPDEYAALVECGVRTLISVPVGPVDTGGVMLVADERVQRPHPTTVNLMELLATQAWTCLDRLRGLAQLHKRAMSDPLTGLRHQGSFNERITVAVPGRTALLAIDIDQFKTINDTYGHQAGDRVLVTVARALQKALRRGDDLYRFGGDEFVAVLDVARPEEALAVAERLTAAARAIGRTVSVGVAVQQEGETPDHTLQRADAALYTVKREGRDGAQLAAA
jgi:diguanylate cyclase (GGDEF)-like protein